MPKLRALFLITLLLSFTLGAGLLWLDSRPAWDDTGVEVGLILLASGACGFLHPKGAWLWGLCVGGWIPGRALIANHDPKLLVVLVIAVLGAYAGAGIRRAMRKVGQIS